MQRWFKRLVLRFRISRHKQQIEAWKSRIDAVLIDRWAALEEMDALSYDGATLRSLILKHALRRLQTKHDELVRQLERL